MNFSKYITLDCNSKYQVVSVNYDNGQLSITVDYTEDLEGRRCTFAVAYDPTIFARPPSQLTFDVKSQTVPLIISNKLS